MIGVMRLHPTRMYLLLALFTPVTALNVSQSLNILWNGHKNRMDTRQIFQRLAHHYGIEIINIDHDAELE